MKDLQRRYAEVFGDETAARNKAWLVKRIAWKVRANVHGGLTDRARQRAAELAAGAELRTTIPAKRATVAAPAEPATLPFPADRRLLPPGSIITRAYKGQTLQVRVLTHGFEHAGRVYPSLSAVAEAVTGSHCNGYLFFRLTKGGGGEGRFDSNLSSRILPTPSTAAIAKATCSSRGQSPHARPHRYPHVLPTAGPMRLTPTDVTQFVRLE